MRIVALEFSSGRRSVAVVAGDAGSEPVVLASAAESTGRNTRVFALVTEVLDQARVAREDVDTVAVGLGPGSYAGIRVAIAVAQGWQLARGVRLVGVSSVACLAAQLRAAGRTGRWTLAVDAQREEFYVGDWEVDAKGATAMGPLRLVSVTELGSRLASGEAVAGPEIVARFGRGLEVFPEAGMLGCLAAGEAVSVAGEMIEPVYLRPSAFVKAPPPRSVGIESQPDRLGHGT